MRRRSLLQIVGLLVWGLALAWFVGGIAEQRISGNLWCEAPGADSVYGEAHWSWTALGTECRYAQLTPDGYPLRFTDSPSASGWLPLGLLVAVPMVAFGGRRLARGEG